MKKITAKYDRIAENNELDVDDDKSIIHKDSYVTSLNAFVSNGDTPEYTINENIKISEEEMIECFCEAFETIQKREKVGAKLFNSLLLKKLCEIDITREFSLETFLIIFSKYLHIIYILP